jgi:hypothetical protein
MLRMGHKYLKIIQNPWKDIGKLRKIQVEMMRVIQVLYLNAEKTMDTMIFKDQSVERNVLSELGFEQYVTLFALYKDMEEY